MKLSELIAHDKKKMSKMNRQQKMQFIWDYYKIPIIAIAAVVFIAVSAFVNSIGRRDVVMYAVLLNNDAQIIECDDTVFSSLLEKAGYDMTKKRVDVRTDLNMGEQYTPEKDGETLQVLTALFAISDMDIYAAPQYYFDIFAKDDGFADLSSLLTEEQKNRYAGKLYYYDGTKLCGLILSTDSPLHKAGYFHNEIIIGIVGNAVNLQAAADFLLQLLEAGI
ncbi:MAG: hypothetical protein IJM15_01630 [Erysipelotrichaceae bacterium]|nr:hypothetical protein [Erysipelotrichaceae bacterium]